MLPTEKPLHPKQYYRDISPPAWDYGGFWAGMHHWQKETRYSGPGIATHCTYGLISLPESHVLELPFYSTHGLTYNPLEDGTLTTKERKAWKEAAK